MPIEIVLPGHGDPFDDHAALIDERFAMHERRARKIRGLLAEQPQTAHEIAQSLWGNVAVTQAYLTLSRGARPRRPAARARRGRASTRPAA